MLQKILGIITKRILFSLFISCIFFSLAQAEENNTPTITIIIDDLGYRLRDDMRALSLPSPVAFSVLPYGQHAERISQMAKEKGHELLLHQPMQAMDDTKKLGPGGLTLNMKREEFIKTLTDNMQRVPNIIGVNNHMGSKLTRHPGQMQWLMETLKQKGQFFVDSVTSSESIAANIAKKNRLAYLRRDIFLDNEQTHEYVRDRFLELIAKAKKKGSALAIGHPHPCTLDVLSTMLVDLEDHGVELIGLKSLLAKRNGEKHYAQSTYSPRSGL